MRGALLECCSESPTARARVAFKYGSISLQSGGSVAGPIGHPMMVGEHTRFHELNANMTHLPRLAGVHEGH